jgi:hypothetical protein
MSLARPLDGDDTDALKRADRPDEEIDDRQDSNSSTGNSRSAVQVMAHMSLGDVVLNLLNKDARTL